MTSACRCVKLQSLPFFPQASTIAPLWSSGISYCDPGMVRFSYCSHFIFLSGRDILTRVILTCTYTQRFSIICSVFL